MRGYSAPDSGRLTRLISSSIGSKLLMALTGLGLLGFLVGHLTGNLLVFAGPDALNEYAAWLHDHPKLLWVARIGLLGMFLAHVGLAFRLTNENKTARPTGYQYQATVQATMASRYMLLTGLVVFAYLVFHLLHFTFQAIDTGGMGVKDAAGNLDVYAMVISGFQNPLVSISYIVANALLGVHLFHGLSSAFQTLGWNHPTFKAAAKPIALGLPILIAGGYIAIPLAIWMGVIS